MCKEGISKAPREKYTVKPNSELYVVDRKDLTLFYHLINSMQNNNIPIYISDYHYTDDTTEPITIRATSLHLPLFEELSKAVCEEINNQQLLSESEKAPLLDIVNQAIQTHLYEYQSTGFPGESPEVI